MSTKKIQLTASGEERLEVAVSEYRERITKYLEENKFVPGEDVVEITALDVKQAVEEYSFGRTRRSRIRQLYGQVAILFGAMMLAAGVLYPSLQITQSPVQIILLAYGACFSFIGFFFHRLTKMRESENRDDSIELTDRIRILERKIDAIKSESGAR